MSILRMSHTLLLLIGLAPVLLVTAASRLLDLPQGAVSVLSLTTMAWAITFTMLGWRRLDETAKEAHKFAWFWGSLALPALMLACLFTPLPTLVREQIVESFFTANPDTGWQPASYGFLAGVLAAALAQIAGWAIVWTGWWIARRR